MEMNVGVKLEVEDGSKWVGKGGGRWKWNSEVEVEVEAEVKVKVGAEAVVEDGHRSGNGGEGRCGSGKWK